MERSGLASADNHEHEQWLKDKWNAIIVVAVLVATMAFTTALTPPGGFWQEGYNETPLHAGVSVLFTANPDRFKLIIACNTLAFICSINTILLLLTDLPFQKKRIFQWVVCSMWIACCSMALTYLITVGSMVSPAYIEKTNLFTNQTFPTKRPGLTGLELILIFVMSLCLFFPWIIYYKETIGKIYSMFGK